MSVRVMAWVWEHSTAEATDRFVLLAIADCANDEGRDAYPSLATLASKTRLHKRTVQRCLDRLVESGELVIQAHGGPGRPNRYRLTMTPGKPLEPDGGTTPIGTPPTRQNAHTAPRRQGVGARPTSSRHSATTDVGTAPTEPPIEPSITVREPSDDTAQVLIGEWLTHCTKRPPSAVIGQVGKQLRALLGEGIDPADVRRGFALWHSKGLHPSTLPSVVNEAMNGRASPGLVKRGSLHVRAETATRMDRRSHWEAVDAATEAQKAIEQ